ncbi:MAG TPA: hypothetical protein VMT34_07570 [Aggregatilineales bacterium]|nr:hypothetical protein [Aggregatilineales bacterium]
MTLRRLLLPAAGAIGIGLLWAWLYTGPYPGAHVEILNHTAANLRSGHGLFFDPGERTLLIFAPLFIGLRALLDARIIFVLALAIAAGSITSIAQRAGLSYRAALLVALITAIAWPLGMGLETAYPLAAALCLLAIAFAVSERAGIAGLLTFLAVLCAPDAILLALPLLLFLWNRGSGQRYVVTCFAPLIVTLVGARVAYGATFWEGLLLLKPISSAGQPGPGAAIASILLIGLAIPGWYQNRQQPVAALCATWIALYALVLGAVLRVDNGWRYAPIAGTVALLAVLALNAVRPAAWTAIAAVLVAVSAYGAAGAARDGSSTTPLPVAGSIVGFVSGDTLERYQGTAAATLVAFDGQFQPELNRMLERDDPGSALVRYVPDRILPDPRFSIHDLTNDPNWKRLGYEAQADGSYVRTRAIGAFQDRPADAIFGPDLRLTGIALDQAVLRPGAIVRIRLDWRIARAASLPVTVRLRLEDGDWIYAANDDQRPQPTFAAGDYSTYHVLTLDSDAPPADYDLTIGVLIGDGIIGPVRVATVTVKP